MQLAEKYLITACWLLLVISTCARAQEKPTTDTTTDADTITQLINQLGDASFEVRAQATRRICALGASTYEFLKVAAAHGQAEISLRANHLLKTLDALMFSGVDVSLSTSASSVRWDESVDLIITFVNQSHVPTRVPFELGSHTLAKTDEGRQVGHLLDAAEYLKVTAPDGSEVSIMIDDMSEHPDVSRIVEQRVEGGMVSTLAPGETATLTLLGFNRGWARYPLYEKGSYRITFDYTPQWSDAVLLSEKVGRVVSQDVHIDIAQAAPSTVSRHQMMGTISISMENDVIIAEAHCASDKPIYINKNFGPRLPFTQVRWEYSGGNQVFDIPVLPVVEGFKYSLIEKVNVGESIEIARLSRKQLRDLLMRRNIQVDAPDATIRLTYANWCNRAWQLREQARWTKKGMSSPVGEADLPYRILSARHASEPILLMGKK